MFKSLGGNGGGGRGFSYRMRTSKFNLLYETRQQRLPCRLGWLASFLIAEARFNRVHPVLQIKAPTSIAHRRHKEEEEDADVLKLGSGL